MVNEYSDAYKLCGVKQIGDIKNLVYTLECNSCPVNLETTESQDCINSDSINKIEKLVYSDPFLFNEVTSESIIKYKDFDKINSKKINPISSSFEKNDKHKSIITVEDVYNNRESINCIINSLKRLNFILIS